MLMEREKVLREAITGGCCFALFFHSAYEKVDFHYRLLKKRK